jgi:hypothetical protein
LLICSFVNATNNEIETGGANMFSSAINKFFFAAATVLLASGCGVAGGAIRHAADVRVATTLEAGSPKLMVSGPARLLHVDVYGHQNLNVYSVKRAADGSVTCAGAVPSDVRPLQQSATNELNIAVAADEGICLANGAGTAPRTDVSWHARRGADASPEAAHPFQAAN